MFSPSAWAVDIKTQPIRFAKGHSAATIKGKIKGYESIDYTLRARAGQTMTVTLKTGNGANYFNVLPPGSNDIAIFVGSTGGNSWAGSLPADGEYKVRVYLMRSAARRGEVAGYTLTVGISGGARTEEFGQAPASDVRVKGSPFHATGPLPCFLGNDLPVQCEFGVIRGKPGNAELHVTQPGGAKRVLTIMGDRVTVRGGATVKAVQRGDDWLVEISDVERYTIPGAVISGG